MHQLQKRVSTNRRTLQRATGPVFGVELLETRQLLSATGFSIVDQSAFPAAPTTVANLPTVFKDDISQAWPTLVNGQLKIQSETLSQEVASAIQAAAQSGQGISATGIASTFNTSGNYNFAVKSTSSVATVVEISYDATGNSTTFSGKINNVKQNFKVTYDLTVAIDLTLPSNLSTGKVTATAAATATNLHVTTNNLTGTVLNDFATNVAKNVGNGISGSSQDLSALAPVSLLTTELHTQATAGYTHLHTGIDATGNLQLTAQKPTLTVDGAANDHVTISAGTNGAVVVTAAGKTETFDGGFLKTIELYTGSGKNTVSVPSLPSGISLQINGAANSNDSVTVGGTGSLAGVAGTVSVSNVSGKTALTVDDLNDSGKSNLTVSNSAVKFSGHTVVTYASNKGTSGVTALTVESGAHGSDITVLGTATGVATTIQTDAGTDAVNIDGCSSALTVASDQGNDTVTVGNGSLAAIGGPITVSNTSGKTGVVVDDDTDTVHRTVDLTTSQVQFQGLTTIQLDNAGGTVTGVQFHDGTTGNTFDAKHSPSNGFYSIYSHGHDLLTGPAANQVTVFEVV